MTVGWARICSAQHSRALSTSAHETFDPARVSTRCWTAGMEETTAPGTSSLRSRLRRGRDRGHDRCRRRSTRGPRCSSMAPVSSGECWWRSAWWSPPVSSRGWQPAPRRGQVLGERVAAAPLGQVRAPHHDHLRASLSHRFSATRDPRSAVPASSTESPRSTPRTRLRSASSCQVVQSTTWSRNLDGSRHRDRGASAAGECAPATTVPVSSCSPPLRPGPLRPPARSGRTSRCRRRSQWSGSR